MKLSFLLQLERNKWDRASNKLKAWGINFSTVPWQIFLFIFLLTSLNTFVVLKGGLHYSTFFLCLFISGLILLTMIDLHSMILPDIITVPLLILGFIASLFHLFIGPFRAALGIVLGYSVLWISNYLYEYIRKRTSIGEGDFKMLAMVGAWLGWEALPQILFIASLFAVMIGITVALVRRKKILSFQMPFGPFIAFGASKVIFIDLLSCTF